MFTMMILQSVLLGCLFSLSAGTKGDWTYKDTANWKDDYKMCGGKRQSPINIVKSKTKYDPSLAKMVNFVKYDSNGGDKKLEIKNNGHTLNIYPSPIGASIKVKGLGDYALFLVHFHWGSVNTKGSEHQIDGKSYSAEIHLVHYNKKYSSESEAKNKSDGIVVIGVMLKLGTFQCFTFDKFLNMSKYNLTEKDANTRNSTFRMDEFLPKPENRKLFYYYNGSFTTPTCDQSVHWIVYDSPNTISKNQMDEFQKLKGKDGKALVDNFRPLQNLNDRTVLASMQLSSGSLNLKASFFVAFFFSVFFFALL